MGDRLAYHLVEVTDDLSALSDGGFWALSSTFEGTWVCAKFGTVIDAPLPHAQEVWTALNGKWNTSLNQVSYMKNVAEVRRQISLGWVYQVNACRQLSIRYGGSSLLPLMHEIVRLNPAPYASYLRLPDLEIASASPELFLQRDDETVLSAPIKGTKHLDDADKNFGEKDQSENIMIVDLIRNDFSQICKTGSVHVPELLQSQQHPGLVHLVSFIEGKVKDGLEWKDTLNSICPPGSVSGAPKSSALSTIKEIESLQRGPYCGALGWVEGDRARLSVAIRIFWDARDGFLRFGTGAGITWGSDAKSEWEETELKARRLVGIAGGTL
jgi:para-aminobenzoate synthetase component 1